ncbi:1-acyl-sn-glycerol-3-phosphate acyltransferase [Algivirga pacifica]|uniref:Phospholipid/glycerol acyltransferase domain-containing protein n=1 Tax=Algivirga pacifica TaxID=1162670 RepID=A0ABP9DEU7_9BACT
MQAKHPTSSAVAVSSKIQDQGMNDSTKFMKAKKKFRVYNEQEVMENIDNLHTMFDAGYAYSITTSVLTHLNSHYFRVKFIGFEEQPERVGEDVPLIYASNHSGMAFPWDAIALASSFFERSDYNLKKAARVLASPALSLAPIMSPFLIPDFWKKLGGVDATLINYDSLMHTKDSQVLIYPEGVPGIGKGFDKKYKLRRLASSTIRMSIKHKTPIVPIATVNGEYINPYSYSMDWVNRLAQKLGIPFLPIGLALLVVPFQPWFFYFGFPAKLTFVKGAPFKPYELVDGRALEQVTEEEIQQLRDQFQDHMQAHLNDSVAAHGTHPFQWKDFWKECKQQWSILWRFNPLNWCMIMKEHHAWYLKEKQQLQQEGRWPEGYEQQIELWKSLKAEGRTFPLKRKGLVKRFFGDLTTLLLYIPGLGLLYMLSKRPSKINTK